MVRNSPAIIYRMSAAFSPPRLTYVSDNVSMLGADAAELIADPALYLALTHPDDRDAVKAAFTAATFERDDRSIEFRIGDASGVYHWMESRHTPKHDARDGSWTVVGALIDVTTAQIRRGEAPIRQYAADDAQGHLARRHPGRRCQPADHLRQPAIHRHVAMCRQLSSMPGTMTSVLAAVAAAAKDPDAFVARVRHIYEHTEEAEQDEVETADGRFLDRHTNVLRTADGRRLGRVWFFRDVSAAQARGSQDHPAGPFRSA